MRRTHLVLAAGLLAVVAAGAAAPARLRPLPRGEAASTHMPYDAGHCDACHARSDPANPGPVAAKPPQLCLDCHDDFTGVKKGHPDRGTCTNCHSPHDAKKLKLLL